MQNLSKPTLWVMAILLIFTAMKAEAKMKAGDNSLLTKCLSQVNFSGTALPCDDKRSFASVEGSFGEEVFAIQGITKSDTLAAAIERLYQRKGLAFSLKRTYANEQTGVCCYTQYWKSFYLENQPYSLIICHDKASDTYKITNNLYMQKINLPARVVTHRSAFNILEEIFYRYQELDDLKSIKVVTTQVDTLKPEYFDGFDSKLRLNLYPDDNTKQTFRLMIQFRGQAFYDVGTYYLDAATGKPVGEAASLFSQHAETRKHVNAFMRKTGFEGDYYHKTLSDPITFNFGNFPFKASPDTLAFRRNADAIVREYLKIWEKAGVKLVVDGAEVMRDSVGEDGCIPDQMIYGEYRLIPFFRNLGGCAERTLNINYNITENTWYLGLMPGEEVSPLPKEVINPQTALQYYLFHTRDDDDPDRNYRFADIPKKMIKTSSLTRELLYYDGKEGVTIQPVYAPDDWMNENSGTAYFCWNCISDNDKLNDVFCLNPVSGRMQGFEVFDPDYRMPYMNQARQEGMKQRIAACLPGIRIEDITFTARDSIFTELKGSLEQVPVNKRDFDTLCSAVMGSLSSLYGFGGAGLEYDYVPFDSDASDGYLNIYCYTYAGYSYYDSHSVRISLNDSSGVFNVCCYICTNQPSELSEQIITPETAWRIAKGLPQPFAWDKREFFPKDADFYPVLPAELKIDEPTEEELADIYKDYYSSLKLVMYPQYLDWSRDIYDKYVLVYRVECNYTQVYYIEAATGKVLHMDSNLDGC